MLRQKLTTIFVGLSLFVGVAPAQETMKLESGQALERQIAGAQTHEYQLTLAAGEFMQVRVQQKGVDVVLILQDVSGQELARMDSPNETAGPEILSWVALNVGDYRVKIQVLDAKATTGQYNIALAPKRPAIEQDRRRVEVEKLFIEGLAIRNKEAPFETTLAQLKAALQGWEELSERRMANLTLREVNRAKAAKASESRAQIAEMTSSPEFREGTRLSRQDTPETLKAAIVKFEEARRSPQGLRYKLAEAHCLVAIGEVYLQLGESENAIAKYKEALTIYQSIPDKDGEATMRSRINTAPLEAIRASAKRQRKEKKQKVGLYPALVVQTGHANSVSSIAFSPDGKTLASGGDMTVKLWEVTSGRELRPLAGQEGFFIDALAFSPDGKTLASSSDETIKLWDITTGIELRTLSGHASFVNSIVFAPDGKTLASGGDKTVKLWEVATGRELRTFAGQDAVTALAFSPDGKTLASYNHWDWTITLWDIASGTALRAFAGHSNTVASLVFSPDGKTLASESWDKTIKLWEVTSGRELQLSDKLLDWVRSVRGETLATINGKVIRADVEEGTKIVLVDNATQFPLATLIALDGKDWVVVDEEGRFDGSDGALQLMHYSYGLDIIGFEQLKDEYYEPNLLQKLLGYNAEPLRAVVPLQDVKLPPEVREQTLSPDGKRLTLKLAHRGGGIGKTEIFLNDKLVIPDARSATLRQNPNVPLNEVVTLTVDLPVTSFLPGKENQIKVVTSNYLAAIKRGNIQSSARGVVHLDRRKSEDTLPSVYALVSGVSDYEGDALDLRFAAKDAEDFSTALALGARRLFCPPGNLQCLNKVNITTLSTNRAKPAEQPTKENFKRALGAIAAKAKPEDIVVIYLAGHGVSLGVNTDTYFYLTKEAKSAAREDLTKNYQTVAISSEELRDWLTQTEWRTGVKGLKPLKQVLILDTCAAGTAASQLALTTKRELSGDQIRAIEFLKDKTGTFVLMGSAADAPSYEASRYGQGLLTYALLQGLKGAALDKGEFVDVQTLFSYAQKEVPRMASNIGGIQRPIISAPLGRTFVIGQMTEAEKGQVRLPSPKPLLLRPLLTNPETGDDDLKLIPALRKRFDAESSYELMKRSNRGEPKLVYVDDDSFPEALRLTGTYTVIGDKVRVTAFLRRDGKTVAMLAEVFTVKEKVVDELVRAVRNALGQLRP